MHLSPLPRMIQAAALGKAIRFRESGRCDGLLIKGGFVCRRLHFETPGVQSSLATAQTGVKRLRCCLEGLPLAIEFLFYSALRMRALFDFSICF